MLPYQKQVIWDVLPQFGGFLLDVIVKVVAVDPQIGNVLRLDLAAIDSQLDTALYTMHSPVLLTLTNVGSEFVTRKALLT